MSTEMTWICVRISRDKTTKSRTNKISTITILTSYKTDSGFLLTLIFSFLLWLFWSHCRCTQKFQFYWSGSLFARNQHLSKKKKRFVHLVAPYFVIICYNAFVLNSACFDYFLVCKLYLLIWRHPDGLY